MSGLPTPDSSILHTPTLPTPQHTTTHTYLHPGHTPYRTGQSYYPSSSPFDASNMYPSDAVNSPLIRDEDESMEMEVDGEAGMEGEVKRRYEETNRLLRELEVVRRERWGDGG